MKRKTGAKEFSTKKVEQTQQSACDRVWGYSIVSSTGLLMGATEKVEYFLYINISKTIHHFRKMNPVLLQNRHIVFVSIQKY